MIIRDIEVHRPLDDVARRWTRIADCVVCRVYSYLNLSKTQVFRRAYSVAARRDVLPAGCVSSRTMDFGIFRAQVRYFTDVCVFAIWR